MKFEVVRREGRGGQRLNQKDANKMYNRLAEMYEENNESLSAEDIVGEAKNKKSPFHKWFEWDDRKAAHQHRLKQARDLIGSVEIVRKKDPREGKDGRIRAFVHISRNVVGPDGSRSVERTYVPTLKAMEDSEKRELLLQQAFADFGNLERKYSDLTELAGVFKSVKKAKEVVLIAA